MTIEHFMRHHYGPSGYVSPNDLKGKESSRVYNVLEQSDTNQVTQERDNLRLRIKAVDQEYEQIKAEREKMIQAYTAVEGDRDFWKREHEGLMATLRETTNQLDTACQDKIVLQMDRDLWQLTAETYKKGVQP